jgi:hypothetical protein
MSHDNSVTHWLDGVKAGDDADIQRIWDRYFQRLVQLASSRLPRHARRMVDEEDIAISAFRSFCDRVGRGQFPDLAHRDHLWRVLFAAEEAGFWANRPWWPALTPRTGRAFPGS